MTTDHIYVDANAGAQPVAISDIRLRQFQQIAGANASSAHALGQKTRNALEQVREDLADRLGIEAKELVFTSSGSESLAMGLFTLLESVRSQYPRIGLVTQSAHHPAAANFAEWYCSLFPATHWIEVAPDIYGSTHWVQAEEKIADAGLDAVVVHEQLAHSEFGTITEIAQYRGFLQRLASRLTVRTHVDACQALGKYSGLATAIHQLDVVDSWTFSGHKLGAPAGIGFNLLRRNYDGQKAFIPGTQEWRRRGGTENVLGALLLGFAVSERLNPSHMETQDKLWSEQTETLRDVLAVHQNIQLLSPTDGGLSKLPNTTFLTLRKKDGTPYPSHKAVMGLSRLGIMVSQGTACRSGIVEANRSALAAGYSEEEASSTLRISFDWDQSLTDAETVANAIIDLLAT